MVTAKSVINFIILITLLLITAIVKILGKLYPVKIGFFCADRSLHLPFREQTISMTFCLTYSIVMPLLLNTTLIVLQNLRRTSPLHVMVKMWTKNLSFLIGIAAIMLLAQLAKQSAGRLRPNFYAVCEPHFNGTRIDCLANDTTTSAYIEHFDCRDFVSQDGVNMKREIFLSFFSGHCALTAHAMAFIALKLEGAASGGSEMFAGLKFLMRLVVTAFSAWVGFTRMTDGWHHAADVIAGSIVGLLVAVYAEKVFNRKQEIQFPPEDELNDIIDKEEDELYRRRPSAIRMAVRRMSLRRPSLIASDYLGMQNVNEEDEM